MKINKTLIIYSLIVFVGLGGTQMLYAQKQNEVSIATKGGFSILRYDAFQNNQNLENTYSFSLGYRYYFNKHWSLGTGLEFQELNGSIRSSLIEDSYSTTDLEGEVFEFHYTVRDYYEKQQLHLLNIPLNLQYESGGVTRFYTAAGASVGFVTASQYHNRAGTISSNGYYEQYNVVLNGPGFAGFGTFDARESSGSDLDLKTNIVLNLESGIKVFLKERHTVYVGLFLDYGLEKLNKQGEGQNLLAYGHDGSLNNFKLNSMLQANNRAMDVAYLKNLKILAYGLKLRYAFMF